MGRSTGICRKGALLWQDRQVRQKRKKGTAGDRKAGGGRQQESGHKREEPLQDLPCGEMKVRALDGVDFEIYKGEFVAIVGTSGSGKSTLLNMLAGLEKPTRGEIEIGSTHIEKMTEKQLVTFRREKVGFIFQSYNLLNTMNAVENVALPFRSAACQKGTG